jgi:hypothetical protein
MNSTLLVLAVLIAAESEKYFAITVVDEATGRGVPLVELRTTNDLTYYTDSQGVVAFFEPGLMNREVFFTVTSHGYEFDKDVFGFRGTKLNTTPGGKAKLSIRRQFNVAERLYRVTGGGIDADSILVGNETPRSEPLLNAQVVGSDSVQQALFRNQIYWFWGDTNRPSYPLGNFHVPGATSELPSNGGLDPAQGVQLQYFVDESGFAKSTCQMAGEGPTWVDGLTVIQEPSGLERMFGLYVKVKPPLTIYEYGIAEYEPDKEQFTQRNVFPKEAPFYPAGHSFTHTVNGQPYVYFCRPFPMSRVKATAESLQDLSQYETFTCLTAGSERQDHLDRDADGKLQYGWKRNTKPLTQELQQQLRRSGKLRPDETCWNFTDIESGKPIRVHHGSLYWNEFRQRWLMIASEIRGSSELGEVWYSEATAPEGPWAYCRKIVTHEKQSFYNPKHHPLFNQQKGRIIYFEGTYTNSFSGNNERTPRYNYNQVMYRLDLNDSRVMLPCAVYRRQVDTAERFSFTPPPSDSTFGEVTFLAGDREFPGSLGILPLSELQSKLVNTGVSNSPRVLFHALPANVQPIPANTVLLYEFVNNQGQSRYATEDQPPAGYRRADTPLCRVWKVPSEFQTADNAEKKDKKEN